MLEVAPVIALTETVRPVLVLVLRLPEGEDVLFSLLYDKEKDAYQKRGRSRDTQGVKQLFPPGKWVRLTDPQAVARVKAQAITDFTRVAEEIGGRVAAIIELSPQASDEELLEQFVASGAFDVVRLDPETYKAKKLA